MAFYYNADADVAMTPTLEPDAPIVAVPIRRDCPVSIASIALLTVVRVPASGTDADVRAALKWLAEL
jgi:hypothetical protein